jgi:hypothetical protein
MRAFQKKKRSPSISQREKIRPDPKKPKIPIKRKKAQSEKETPPQPWLFSFLVFPNKQDTDSFPHFPFLKTLLFLKIISQLDSL